MRNGRIASSVAAAAGSRGKRLAALEAANPDAALARSLRLSWSIRSWVKDSEGMMILRLG